MANRTTLPFEWTSLVLIAKERKADVHMRVRPGAIIEADEIIQALVAENLRLNKEAYTWWEAAVQRKPIATPISPASVAGSAGDGWRCARTGAFRPGLAMPTENGEWEPSA